MWCKFQLIWNFSFIFSIVWKFRHTIQLAFSFFLLYFQPKKKIQFQNFFFLGEKIQFKLILRHLYVFWQWGNKHCIQQDFPLNTKTWYTLNCVKSLSPHSYVGLSHGVNIISAQLHKTYKGKTVIPVIYNKKKENVLSCQIHTWILQRNERDSHTLLLALGSFLSLFLS